MSDDERIARLTELARRVWPDVEVERGYGDDVWLVSNESGVALSIDHPRALDAMEAALLVLAREPPAWVEQLAARWEQEALCNSELGKGLDESLEGMADAFNECAFALRERVKETT